MKQYRVFSTEFGYMAISATEKGLTGVALPADSEEDALFQLGLNVPDAVLSYDLLPDFTASMKRYFQGERIEFRVEIDFTGATNFQRRVWQATMKIPYGETRSYGWVAAQAENPGASRAAGNALGRNPVPIVVPCHRVIAGDGSIGGFSSGLDRKQRLLALESIELPR